MGVIIVISAQGNSLGKTFIQYQYIQRPPQNPFLTDHRLFSGNHTAPLINLKSNIGSGSQQIKINNKTAFRLASGSAELENQ